MFPYKGKDAGMQRPNENLGEYEAVYRLEYERNRFIQICRAIRAKTIGLATLFAMEWARQEKLILQDVIEANPTPSW
jgi:hypothetical protein